MKFLQTAIAVFTAFFVTSGTTAQDLTPAQQTEISQRAYSLYYTPQANGFVSTNCEVKLNWSTMPQGMLGPAEHAGRDYLHETKLHLVADAKGAQEITRDYPRGTLDQSKPAYDKFFDWTSKTIGGFLSTWKAKALENPIPTAKSISHFASTPDGYQITTPYGDTTVVLSLSKDLVITRILTLGVGQSMDERTTYTQTPRGLILTAVDATNTSAKGTNHISYDLTYQPGDPLLPADSILFPAKVHLVVDKTIDMRFSFENCSVKRGAAVNTLPTTGSN